MKITNISKAVAILALLTFSSMSNALMITLDDGSNPIVTITDGGAGDADGVINGAITNFSSLGAWSIISTTAFSSSSSLFAHLYETSLNVSSSSAGTLTVTVEDTYTGLANVGGGGSAKSSITPTDVGGSIAYTSDLNTGATIVHAAFLTVPVVSSGSTSFTVSDPLTITQTAVITHGSGGGVTSFDASTHVSVPEPVSLALLGIGLIGLGLARKRAV